MRAAGVHSGGPLVCQLRPDALPVLRPQISARDLAAGGLFDGGAVLDGNSAAVELPLMHGALRHAKQCSQARLRSDHAGSDVDGVSVVIHALSIGGLYMTVQELLDPPDAVASYAAAMDRSAMAKWVRDARKARGWTQDQLGDAIGVTKGNVSHWETGKHDPSFLQLLMIRDKIRNARRAFSWPTGIETLDL